MHVQLPVHAGTGALDHRTVQLASRALHEGSREVILSVVRQYPGLRSVAELRWRWLTSCVVLRWASDLRWALLLRSVDSGMEMWKDRWPIRGKESLEEISCSAVAEDHWGGDSFRARPLQRNLSCYRTGGRRRPPSAAWRSSPPRPTGSRDSPCGSQVRHRQQRSSLEAILAATSHRGGFAGSGRREFSTRLTGIPSSLLTALSLCWCGSSRRSQRTQSRARGPYGLPLGGPDLLREVTGREASRVSSSTGKAARSGSAGPPWARYSLDHPLDRKPDRFR